MDKILDFWFPDDNYQKWWFKSTPELDNKIYNIYFELFQEVVNNFDMIDYNDETPKNIISTIILLDQFSRNMVRINKKINVKESTDMARELSSIWINKFYYLKEPIYYTIFAFMPIRHQRNLEDIKNLIVILEYIECNDNKLSSNIIFSKFRDHTIRNLIALKLINM
jgi:uncharacterized protein (DUF924 family)